jgi:hypothetical protein
MKRKYCFMALLPFILCALLLPGCKELFHPSSGDDDNNNNTTGLSAPTGLSAYVNNGNIYISWNAVSGAEWYEILVSDTPNGSYESWATKDGTSYSKSIGTDSAVSIYIKIRACSTGKESPLSAYFHLTEYTPTPDVLTVTVTETTSSSVSLSWNSIDGVYRYQVSRSDSLSGSYSPITSSSGLTSTSYTDSDLPADTTYYYKVRAITSSYSTIIESEPVRATTQQSITPVLTVTVTETTSSSVSLSWNSISGAYYYSVERKQGNYDTYIPVMNSLILTSWTDTSLSANTTYYYKVSAYAYASYSTIAESEPVQAATRSAISLSSNQWTSNTLSAGISQYYSFFASAGTTYNITWNDSADGNYKYTCNIKVSASTNGSTIFTGANDGYTNPAPVTVATSGYVTIKVEGFDSSESGSYAIKYYY